MKKIIEKYCNNSEIKNGLMLVDMPTGTGKTYAVIEYIKDNYESFCQNGGKIFFVTTLKKNLPIDDLRKKFVDDGKLHKFDEDFLFIDSNVQCLIDKFNSVKGKIPTELSDKDLFRRIEVNINTIKDYESMLVNKKDADIEREDFSIHFVEKAKEELQNTLERQFRTSIETLLKFDKDGKKRTKKEKEDLVAQQYSWIKELYPAVRTDKAKIIFMSLDKFLTRNCTLIEPSYMFYSSKILNNSIVFIDEFDASKDTILKSIIDNSIKDKIGLISLFRAISSGLSDTEFTNSLLKVSDVTANNMAASKSTWKTPEQIILLFQEKAEEIAKKYNLEYLHKLEEVDQRATKFIFHDIRFHNILSEKNKEAILEKDDNEHVNWIKVVDNIGKAERDTNNLYALLNDLRIFIDYFQRGIGYIATNYMMRKRMSFADYSYESAVRTVLAEFSIEGKNLNYLVNNIMNNQKKTKEYLNDIKGDFDLTVYEKGFRYYDFLNGEDFDTQSRIDLFSFTETPEKFINKIANKAKVIGLSASATLPTVTGNYDLKYLQEVLGSKYVVPSDEDKQRLKAEFVTEHTKNYSKVDIQVRPVQISEMDDLEEKLIEILGDEEIAQKILSEDIYRLTTDNFIIRRYFKVFIAMKEFLLCSTAKSFLCLMNTIAYSNKKDFNLELLKTVFNELSNTYAPEERCQIWTLGGDLKKFESIKQKIHEQLKKGTKVFVLSTYQTLGAGQNLQYEIPEFLTELIAINDSPYGNKQKDFDGIYLDKPTNIFVNLNSGEINDSNFIKFLFYVEFLQESGEISMQDADMYVKRGFNIYRQGDKNKIKTPEVDSVNLHYARIILQAIGRICRTKKKSPNIIIMYDSEVNNNLAAIAYQFDNRLVNPEFRRLLDGCGALERDMDAEEDKYIRKAEKKSYSLSKYVTSFMKSAWTINSMDEWKKLREITLKYPVLAEQRVDVPIGLYVELIHEQAGYFYEKENDYNSIKIAFRKQLSNQVSKNACRLDILMQISGVKDFFESQGYATTFNKGKYIIAPIIFNNIYKGALGEVIGKYILENCVPESWNTKVVLKDIEDEASFEKFDFECNGCFIDFKHWEESAEDVNSISEEDVLYKLAKCGGEKAIIINILSSEGKSYSPRQIGDKILVIPYLYDVGIKRIDFKMLSAIRSFIL